MLTILLPILYVGGLLSILTTVVKAIRGKSQSVILGDYVLIVESGGYFPINRQKLEYEELSEQYSPDDANGNSILSAALMKRAMEGFARLQRLREEKPPLKQMVREGVIGEDILEKLTIAEVEVNQDMAEMKSEADLYKTRWSSTFINEAARLYQLQLQKEAIAAEESDNKNENPKEQIIEKNQKREVSSNKKVSSKKK